MLKKLVYTVTLLFCITTLFAEVVLLKDGSIIKGKIIKMNEDIITVLSNYGEMVIDRSQVVNTYFDEDAYYKSLNTTEKKEVVTEKKSKGKDDSYFENLSKTTGKMKVNCNLTSTIYYINFDAFVIWANTVLGLKFETQEQKNALMDLIKEWIFQKRDNWQLLYSLCNTSLKTPNTFDIPVGKYIVWVGDNGKYTERKDDVIIKEGQTTTLDFTGFPTTIKVISDWVGAEVYFNDVYIGTTPCDGIVYVKPASVNITIKKDGNQFTKTVPTVNGEDLKIVSMESKPTTVNVTTNVIGAEVYAEGKYVGVAPCNFVVYGKPASVSLVAKKTNFYDGYYSVDINEVDNTVNAKVNLKMNFSYRGKAERSSFGFSMMFFDRYSLPDASEFYKLAIGVNYHIVAGNVNFIKWYSSIDVLFASATAKPYYMESGFIFASNIAFGLMFQIPINRVFIEFGGAPKVGFMIENVVFTQSDYLDYYNDKSIGSSFYEDSSYTKVLLGIGAEAVVGIKVMITDRIGFFAQYKIGLLEETKSLENTEYKNIDGQYCIIGIRF